MEITVARLVSLVSKPVSVVEQVSALAICFGYLDALADPFVESFPMKPSQIRGLEGVRVPFSAVIFAVDNHSDWPSS